MRTLTVSDLRTETIPHHGFTRGGSLPGTRFKKQDSKSRMSYQIMGAKNGYR